MAARGPPNIYPKTFAFIFGKTEWRSHARGSNEQPVSGCLQAPAHRRAARLVHAPGWPVHEAVSPDSRTARDPGDLQGAGSAFPRPPAPGGVVGGECLYHLRPPVAAGGADGF